MAKKTIRTLSEGTLKDLARLLRDSRDPDRSALQRRRWPAPGKSKSAGDSSGGTGGGGCCCTGYDCVRVPGLDSGITLKPLYYEFTPSTLLCGCDPDSDGQETVRLYPTDDEDIWESLHGEEDSPPQCLGRVITYDDCTRTSTWRWNATDGSDCGTCTFERYTIQPGGFPGIRFVSSQCFDGCDCPETPSVFDPGVPPGQYFDLPCEGVASSTGEWVLVDSLPEDCFCTPAAPDYDGSEDGELAETTCDGTGVSSTSEELLTAFWRLRIIAEGAYGCDGTVLEFIIGDNVILSFRLTHACIKPFCPLCVNSFTLTTCLPDCTSGPTTICLLARRPDYVPGTSGYCGDEDSPGIPTTIKLTFSEVAANLNCAVGGYLTGAGTALNDEIICTISDGRPGLIEYYWRGRNSAFSITIHVFGECSAEIIVASRAHPACNGGSDPEIVAIGELGAATLIIGTIAAGIDSRGVEFENPLDNFAFSDTPGNYPSFWCAFEPVVTA